MWPKFDFMRRLKSRLLIGGETFFGQLSLFGHLTLTGDSRPLVDPTHPIQVFLDKLEHQDSDLIGFVVVRPLIPS